ncbi:viperin family antiviral radical SAM protein [Succinimonas amylolytica]|uniref:viperin family antiviral radical SAM protein n=1 Tax=Succinimonas amylolytica TaxID=83769 RepID=UPI00037B4BC5|nr:viperin family antiviral radical SAM protein [Succinimonas amylolytica]
MTAQNSSSVSGCTSGFAPIAVSGTATPQMPRHGLKFNLHIIETCNYRCRHCFAHFGSCRVLRFDTWRKIIDRCRSLVPGCSFNIAGGEPLMHPDFTAITSYIHSLGHPVSVISNGFLMTDAWLKRHVPLLSCLGLSIDSMNPETLKKIGRCTGSGRILGSERLASLLDTVVQISGNCSIKINTVVSALNKSENMARFIRTMPVSRWKIFKMNLFRNASFSNADIVVSDHEYRDYAERNTGLRISDRDAALSVKTRISDTCEAVLESDLHAAYLMIDARGFLVDNTLNDSYVPVADAANGDLAAGLARLSFNDRLYRSRYTF